MKSKTTKKIKVILFMAISLNGIIARKNNDEDFLSDDNWTTFVELAHKTGCMIWGRRTQEVVKTWGEKYHHDIRDIIKVVVTKETSYDPGEGFVTAPSPKEALDMLQNKGFTSVILTGGSKNNGSFAREGLIDEVIFNVNPIIIGTGIPVVAADELDLPLKFLNSKKASRQIVQLTYRVEK